eukprot:4126366-Pyramimonas_sp.AAC.1
MEGSYDDDVSPIKATSTCVYPPSCAAMWFTAQGCFQTRGQRASGRIARRSPPPPPLAHPA